MGGFYSSVQVELGADDTPETVAVAVSAALTAVGFAPAPDPRKAGRRIAISERGTRWLAVYDGAAEQDMDLLDQLAAAISKATSRHAIALIIHDGDTLTMHLHREGDLIDRFESDPEYFDPVSAAHKRETAGAPARWAGVLGAGVEPEELARVFESCRKQSAHGEPALGRVAELVGWESGTVFTAHRYLQRRLPEGLRIATELGFDLEGMTPVLATGAPRFDFNGEDLEARVGEAFRLFLFATNLGGGFKGVRVVLRGSALEEALIGDLSATLGLQRGDEPPLALSSRPGDAGLGGQRPDLIVGAGLTGDDFRERLPAGMWTPFWDVQQAASLRLVLEGTAMKAGAGKLVVAVGPLDADELAGDVCKVEIRDRAARRRK